MLYYKVMELNPHVVRNEAIKVGSLTKKLQLQSNIEEFKDVRISHC